MKQNTNNKHDVPIWQKYTLTIEEASAYFNIGDKKIRQIINESIGSENEFAIFNGTKCLVNRKKFESYLDKVKSI